jgi:hypothetical protein
MERFVNYYGLLFGLLKRRFPDPRMSVMVQNETISIPKSQG